MKNVAVMSRCVFNCTPPVENRPDFTKFFDEQRDGGRCAQRADECRDRHQRAQGEELRQRESGHRRIGVLLHERHRRTKEAAANRRNLTSIDIVHHVVDGQRSVAHAGDGAGRTSWRSERGQHVPRDEVAFGDVRVSGEDERVDPEGHVRAQLGDDLIGVADDRRAASRSGSGDAGPQVLLDEPVVVGGVAQLGLA